MRFVNREATLTDEPQRLVSERGQPTWEVAYLFPYQGNWTEADYLALDTNRPIELFDGCLEFLPMPTILHQLIAQFLFGLLDAFVRGHVPGKVILAPCPVRLGPGQFREPDVFYLRPERIVDLREPPEGADLLMEVVSPGAENRQRDLEEKRAEYARARIPEYWIVDSEQQQITVLVLDGTAYRVHGTFGPGTEATSVVLPGFRVAVTDVFAAAQLNS